MCASGMFLVLLSFAMFSRPVALVVLTTYRNSFLHRVLRSILEL